MNTNEIVNADKHERKSWLQYPSMMFLIRIEIGTTISVTKMTGIITLLKYTPTGKAYSLFTYKHRIVKTNTFTSILTTQT